MALQPRDGPFCRLNSPNGANEFIVARERQPPDHLHEAGSHDGYSAVMDRVL